MLVLRPGALGDALLAVPALRALRRRFGRLTLASHGPAARLLEACGEVDHGLAFDDPSLSWLFSRAPHPGPLPQGGEGNQLPIVAWLDPSRIQVNPLITAPSRPADEATHCAWHLLRSVVPLGCEPVLDDRPLTIAAIPSEAVLVHPGSGSPRKNWPPEKFASVIRHVDNVRLVVGEADAPAAQAVDNALGRRLPRLVLPTLEELASHLAGCRAYLGNDSGLFGPTPASVWRPLGPRVQVLDFAVPPEEVAQALRGCPAHGELIEP
jgi:hypothetical protein